jgi:hypothetical protein
MWYLLYAASHNCPACKIFLLIWFFRNRAMEQKVLAIAANQWREFEQGRRLTHRYPFLATMEQLVL